MLTSCATRYLWDNTSTYVAIPQSDACEKDLDARGVKYIRSSDSKVFFVEKSNVDKCKTYAIRTIMTPFTVTIDAATTIAVVGGAVFLIAHTPGNVQAAEASRARQKEMEAVDKTLDDIRRQEKEKRVRDSEVN